MLNALGGENKAPKDVTTQVTQAITEAQVDGTKLDTKDCEKFDQANKPNFGP